ncbi:hypothetical protein SAMN04489798_1900 [Pseudomonas arsenicoxydans]|uniref:Uncharacterized protein n=1 Tax=Pseudomonas arsenicoxydans TaxID=702115 RepID=A0A1H0GH23_9PSED|nr:hypothetical protein SAMN04489798_1900 [Pseudomonas arsenicoxydans]
MKIFIEKDPALNRWWVHMDVWVASFCSLDGAESFVERLNSRINAPHALYMIGGSSLLPQNDLKQSSAESTRCTPPLKKCSHA